MVDIPFPLEGNDKSKEEKKSFSSQRKELSVNINYELSSLTTRLRILEEKQNNLRRKVQFIEQNLIDLRKKMLAESKTIISDIKEIKRSIEELKRIVSKVIDDLSKFARVEDVKVLQKYVNFFQPLNFVTHKELEKILN